MPTRSLCCAGLILTCFVPDADGIVRRHDVDDARHVELAQGIDSVVVVGGACGTLVGPRWILTAGHVASNIGPVNRSVFIGGREHMIDLVLFHPTWRGEPSEESVDMALLRLSEPVTTVEPEVLHESRDELGAEVLFVGPGQFGTGAEGPVGEDGVLRGATNTVDQIPMDGWMSFQFNSPPDATQLEGISGPGDSGGPAFIVRDGRRYVAGVSSSNDDHGLGHCRYDTTEYYARVSTSVAWIRNSMEQSLDAPADEFADVQFLEDATYPDSHAGRVAEAFFAQYDSDDPAVKQEFEETWRAASALARRSVQDRVDSWPSVRAQLGAQAPVAFVETGILEISVLSKNPESGEWFSFVFRCEEAPPNKLLVIEISQSPPLHQ